MGILVYVYYYAIIVFDMSFLRAVFEGLYALWVRLSSPRVLVSELSYLVDLRLANKVRFDLTDSLIDLAIGAARRGVALA